MDEIGKHPSDTPGMTTFLRGVFAGLTDCIYGIVTIKKLDSDILQAWEKQRLKTMGRLERRRQPEIPTEEERKKKSLIHTLRSRWAINVVFVFISIVLFYYVILPFLLFLAGLISADFVEVVQDRILPLLSTIFRGLWVIPLLILMEVINAKFYLDISNLVYIVHRRRNDKSKSSISFLLADRTFSLAVLTTFMLQTRLIRLLPISHLVEISYVLHLSQLYAFCAFEYRWCFEGLPFEARLGEMEYNWNYFLGFGLPLALLTWLAPNWAMSAFFMYMVFPLYIISSQQARQHRTYKLTFPLRLFRPSVYLVNMVLHNIFSWLTHLNPSTAGQTGQLRSSY